MKKCLFILIGILLMLLLNSCKHKEQSSDMNIVYLHHSTGRVIWKGAEDSFILKVARRLSTKFTGLIESKGQLPLLFEEYNKKNGKNYIINEIEFPKAKPYGWHNFPYDYYNIWVKNAGDEMFMKEPTLEILTKEYQVVIFKHCFPVSSIQEDTDSGDINSKVKTISNYKLQYLSLRDKLIQFPSTKFILFTGAVHVKSNISEDEAIRANEFFQWVINEWDLPADNIYLWDLYNLQTEGGLYFKDEYAVSPNNSHPNKYFAINSVKLLFNRIIDVIEMDGKRTSNIGEMIIPE